MAEFPNLQTASWRPRQREPLFDGQVKLIALAAAGLITVAALGYGGYALLGGRSHVVPVVEADPRPLRVRPDNPGGMQVVGADELAGAANGQVEMAPPPEAPAPQALRAKINAETRAQREAQAAASQAAASQAAPNLPPATVPTATTQPASMVSPPPAPPSQLSSMAEHPATGEKPAASAKASTASPPVASPMTGTQVQLAALDSEQAAKAEWQRLSHKLPGLLSSRQPAVQRAEHDGKVIFRLRTGGFTDVAAATAFCTQVRSKGAGCSIANF